MSSFIGRLIERRVPQYLLVYIGVSWGLLQFTQFIVDMFLLSPHWTRIVFFAALMLWPGFLLFVYNHGRPGHDKWLLAEKISIPTNLLAAVAALYFMFQGHELGAATQQILVEDEDGNVIERQIPKQEFIKRTMLFGFDPADLSDEDAWLPAFATQAVVVEMYSNHFFDPVSPEAVADQIVKAGYPRRTGLPLSLKLKLAEDTKSQWLFSGDFGKLEQTYTLVTRLHRVDDGSLVAERSYSGDDIYTLIDRISVDLRKDLEIPGGRNIVDLPVVEYYTRDLDALAAHARAGIAVTLDNDFPRAITLLDEALAADPAFTLAQFFRYRVLANSNRIQEAVESLRLVLDSLYELPDRLQYIVKSDYYFFTQDIDKAFAVVEMWADLYPEDQEALANLFAVQMNKNLRLQAIATLEKMYALNAGLADHLKQISALQASLGNFAAAETAIRRYIELFPEDVSGILTLAEFQIVTGADAAAARTLDRASLLEPNNFSILLLMARITGAEGKYQETEALYQQALALAATPAEKANVYSNQQFFYQAYGRTALAIAALDNRLREISSYQPPLAVAQSRLTELTPYLRAGRVEEAKAILESVRAQLQPPYNVVASIGDIRVSLHEKDVAGAEAALQTLETFINLSRIENLRPTAMTGRAEVAELKEDWAAALSQYREILRQNPSDLLVHTPIATCLRHLGQLQEARQSIDEALRLIPANASAHMELSHILEAQGQLAAAREAVEQALVVWSGADPTFAPAAEARERLAAL